MLHVSGEKGGGCPPLTLTLTLTLRALRRSPEVHAAGGMSNPAASGTIPTDFPRARRGTPHRENRPVRWPVFRVLGAVLGADGDGACGAHSPLPPERQYSAAGNARRPPLPPLC